MYGLGFYGLAPVIIARPANDYTQSPVAASPNKTKKLEMPVTPRVLKEKFVTAGLALCSLPVIYMLVQS